MERSAATKNTRVGLSIQRISNTLQNKIAAEPISPWRREVLLRDSAGLVDPSYVPPIVHSALRLPGEPLDAETRAFMEQRFQHDFSQVRVHTGGLASQSARAVNALAYTVGTDVVFAAGQYTPDSADGRRLIGHELTHVVQQTSGLAIPPGVDSGSTDSFERAAEACAKDVLSPDWKTVNPTASRSVSGSRISNQQAEPAALSLQRQKSGTEPPTGSDAVESDWLCDPLFPEGCVAGALWEYFKSKIRNREKGFEGGGGGFGGGGAGGSWSPAPAPSVAPPTPAPPIAAEKKLNFFHGTRWSIAKQIPRNVKPIGGGDFATGFYTHHDVDQSKALRRAVEWGSVMAKSKPPEPYAGVVRFKVPDTDYFDLFKNNRGKMFDLQSLKQVNFKQKQKEWLDFVTTHGREREPTFMAHRDQWVHRRRQPQPALDFNIIKGPFYSPLRGTQERKPAPEEFKPYAEGAQLPQQVLWANEGINLLNSAKVSTDLMQYDAKTGKRQDPPVDTPVPISPGIQQLTEEAQMEWVGQTKS